MRTLLTGAGGQVGIDLIRRLVSAGDDVLATDLRGRPKAAADLPADLDWRALDVTDADAVRQLVADFRPDRIFHLAAILSARGEAMPDVTYQVNQTGTYNVLEACRLENVGQLIFTSTIAVFGPDLPKVVGDDVSLRPTTMYGVTKAAGEMLGEYYARRYGLDFRGVRFPGLISASIPGGGTSDYALYMYVDGVRTGAYEAFCRSDTKIPLMYMPDGIRALIELSNAPRERLTRCVYNIAAFAPTAQEIGYTVAGVLPGAKFTFAPDPRRQAILDSWPDQLLDVNARHDWDWRPEYDLGRMTEDLIPKIRALLERDAEAFAHAD